jgi:RNA 2',3'-cyclic 3'-phosphodiesterase
MRLFVGIELSEHVRAAAAAAGERLRERLKRARLAVEARWIPAENLHVTVWFIGEVAEARAGEIERALAKPFDVAAFDLAVAGCGAFPPSGPPRVFWFGIASGREPLARISGDVDARLAPLGFEPERRAYSPHLTIARVKDPGRGNARAIREVLASEPGDCGACRIEAVTLFRSRTSPKGATYEALLRVPLS